MNKNEIRTLFYKDKNYSKTKELLKGNSDAWSFNILAKIAIEEKETEKAKLYFDLANNFTGIGYILLLENKINEAKKYFLQTRSSSSIANWLNILCNFFENKFEEIPTYMQIRNFFEQDLEMFFYYKNTQITEKMINECLYFYQINGEVYKYCGRVLLHNNNLEEAKKFIKKSLDTHYYDVETHYLLGEINEKQGLIKQAIISYKRVTDINPQYYPALSKINLLSN